MGTKVGFIGCGNMGTAMIQGMLDSGKCAKSEMMASDKSESFRKSKGELLGITMTDDNKEVADTSGSPVKTQNGLTDSGNPNNRSEVSPFIAHFTATSSLKPKSTVSETFFRGV